MALHCRLCTAPVPVWTKGGKSPGLLSIPSTGELSHQLVCTNDSKITVIISTMEMADATHNCLNPTLAIKCGFYHDMLELHSRETILHLIKVVLW